MVHSNASTFMVDLVKYIIQVEAYIIEQLQNISFPIEFDILLLFHVWQ